MTETPVRKGFLGALRSEHRELLLSCARETAFAADALIFGEGTPADRFWIVRTGSVTLDLEIPGLGPGAVEVLGPGELLGWSWLFPPYVWHLAARASSPVRALEFESAAVRELCDKDHELGHAVTRAVAHIMGQRLQRTRTRLLNARDHQHLTR